MEEAAPGFGADGSRIRGIDAALNSSLSFEPGPTEIRALCLGMAAVGELLRQRRCLVNTLGKPMRTLPTVDRTSALRTVSPCIHGIVLKKNLVKSVVGVAGVEAATLLRPEGFHYK